MSIDFLPQPTGITWQKQAACRAENVDPEWFFPERHVAEIALAREICAGCPVARECLIDCMAYEGGKPVGSRHGVYAGLSPKQRQRLYEQLRTRAKTRPQPAEERPVEKPAVKKREPARCGTRPGYQKHLREKTEICQPCRDANTAADRRLRNTGTTKQLAA
ncbi:WhiB family transcriptional regulator [Streptomyces sp. NPDC020490]|uniref:WhiB family transcriptional regulator n=1 Tax=Streptomyces sp. NPDC020490 TaxID=3365078 RepID=UPI00379BA3F2